ncbi:hypothetical protein [Pseudofrankia sp. BMG5.36]|uniref:hypothetical protein n=1 Tax=Pseudofrankia sp. BMG5.36 TaxID=1834512 RepID=UPI0008D8ED70|nr:hypothetical protein [Pseudofrankia sp. BMG5.36]OHV45343.1 hypothetical protein BCD48_23185 [Pseudofrankia sp. BMG5.36]
MTSADGSPERPKLVATVTVRPDSTAAELSAQLGEIPAGMRFIDCFGDRALVLVYGPPGVAPSDVVAAVIASAGLAVWDR